jgi:hypothetical protein
MAIVVQEKAHLRVQFRGCRVNAKLWLKWKGRKAVPGWTCRRTEYREHVPTNNGRFVTVPSGSVVFTCWDRKAAFNMTDEKIEEIKTMMQLLKEQT